MNKIRAEVDAEIKRSENMIGRWVQSEHKYPVEKDTDQFVAMIQNANVTDHQILKLIDNQPHLVLYKGSYPLRVAAKAGRSIDVIKKMVQHGADPEGNTCYDDHYSLVDYTQGALIQAAIGNNLPVVQYFVQDLKMQQPQRHPGWSSRMVPDDSALEQAFEHSTEQMVAVLIEAGWTSDRYSVYVSHVKDESQFRSYLFKFKPKFTTVHAWQVILEQAVQYSVDRLTFVINQIPDVLHDEIKWIDIVGLLIYPNSEYTWSDDSDEEKRLLLLLSKPNVSINDKSVQRSLGWNGGVKEPLDRLLVFQRKHGLDLTSDTIYDEVKRYKFEKTLLHLDQLRTNNKRTSRSSRSNLSTV